MHILDEALNQAFFKEFDQILHPILEKEGLSIARALFEEYYRNTAFRHTILKTKFRHHKRKLAQLQILAQKQNLEIERKVFQIVRETIQIENFNEEIRLLDLYLTFIFKDEHKSKTYCII